MRLRRRYPNSLGQGGGGWAAAVQQSIQFSQDIFKRTDKCKWQCDWAHFFNKDKKQRCKCQCASSYGSNYAGADCCRKFDIHTPFSPCPDGINYFDHSLVPSIPSDMVVDTPGVTKGTQSMPTNNIIVPALIAAGLIAVS